MLKYLIRIRNTTLDTININKVMDNLLTLITSPLPNLNLKGLPDRQASNCLLLVLSRPE